MINDDNPLAIKRYYIISGLRLCGAIILAVGLAVIANNFRSWPIELGYLLFAIGAFFFIVMPVMLARKWKSPPEQ
jgi:hypothetical protein